VQDVASPLPPTEAPSPRPATKKIIVVNDNPEFLELVETLLAEERYDVVICQYGDRAYQLIKDEQPGLVILDIRMVGVDEWQVLDMIKLDPATAGIPVIICSAAVREIQAAEERLREQNCDVLLKPFNIEELVDKVRARIGQP
jgi:CheY-like chemotaxis protein